jgi:hypothetical protein
VIKEPIYLNSMPHRLLHSSTCSEAFPVVVLKAMAEEEKGVVLGVCGCRSGGCQVDSGKGAGVGEGTYTPW